LRKSRTRRLMVRNERGELRAITAGQAKSFEVYERRPLEISAGDRLLITANRHEPNFRATNGEIVTVARVDERGLIRLEDGRVLPPNFKQFAHGYAVTAHRSQGKSVDKVIVSGDGMQKELFYVAASRGRESVVVITSDKERLRETVARSTARQSASELAPSTRPGLQQGMNRGFEAACKLARWGAQYLWSTFQRQRWHEDVIQVPRMERSHDLSIDR
jgi:ATP-dependent exoDNAse (exonuclease V) alpha subunit